MVNVGFFDVDSRVPSPGGGLVIRDRAERIRGNLEAIFRFARANRMVVVSTICLHVPVVRSGLPQDALYVPGDRKPPDWPATMRGRHEFILHKRSCGSREANIRCRAYDVFHSNPHAVELIRHLPIDTWIVFGVSADFCVRAVVEGLTRMGRRVVVLKDVLVPSRQSGSGLGGFLSHLREMNVRIVDCQECLTRLGNDYPSFE